MGHYSEVRYTKWIQTALHILAIIMNFGTESHLFTCSVSAASGQGSSGMERCSGPVASSWKPNSPFTIKSSKNSRHGKEAGACPTSALWVSSTWALCSSSQLQKPKVFSLPGW